MCADYKQIMWSACLDSGNSHEVVTEGGKHKGAMTQVNDLLHNTPDYSSLCRHSCDV